MKRIYPLAFLAVIAFASCSRLNPENRITGNWKLDDVVKKHLFSGDHLLTGYEAGTFSFYPDGFAEYNEGSLHMTGNWNMRYEDRGYYDNDGNYQSKNDLTFSIRLGSTAANQYLDLFFDDTDFKRGGDRVDGLMYFPFHTYQYSFRKL